MSIQAVEGDSVASGASLLARLERLPTSRWHAKVRTIIGTATFFDSFDSFSIAFVLPIVAAAWHLTPGQIGALISVGFLGQIIGAIGFGYLAERIGRVPAISICVAVFSITSLGMAASANYEWLFAMRFLQGIGLGGEVPIAASYIGEISKAHKRGRFVLLYEMIFAVGLVVAAMLGRVLVPSLGWQSMYLIGGIPALALVPFVFRLPESVRWLIGRGRMERAESVLTTIERDVEKHAGPLPQPSTAPQVVPKAGRTSELFSGAYFGRTLLVWVLWFAVGALNYGLTTWLPTVYTQVFKLPLATALNYSLIAAIGGFIGALICALVIDKTGRRLWFFGAFLLGSLPLIAIGLTTLTAELVFIATATSLFFISTMSQCVYLYTPEIYPTRLRAVGCGTASAWLRIASMVAPPVVGAAVSGGRLDLVFMGFGIFGVAVSILCWIFVTETTDRVLEEVSP